MRAFKDGMDFCRGQALPLPELRRMMKDGWDCLLTLRGGVTRKGLVVLDNGGEHPRQNLSLKMITPFPHQKNGGNDIYFRGHSGVQIGLKKLKLLSAVMSEPLLLILIIIINRILASSYRY